MLKPANILETIVARKKAEVASLRTQTIDAGTMRQAKNAQGARRNFRGALQRSRRGSIALIAEVKKASPSAGVICKDFDPVRIAREYEAAGADCLSVLTDEFFFQGSLEYLRRIREAVSLPLLRKDFIIDERQILEAIEWGADAILLIVSILSDPQLRSYQELAAAAGMEVLVEVHDEQELDRALSSGATLIGVNNRDLKTFQVDLSTTERLARRLRENPAASGSGLLVAESGIQNREHVEQLRHAGACAILVGESLMRGESIASKVKELLGGLSGERMPT